MKPKVYQWPAPTENNNSICLSQSVTVGNLLINGLLAKDIYPGSVINYYNSNFWSQTKVYTIDSIFDLSGYLFKIDGFLNSAPVTQNVTGPNKGSVTTTQTYDVVTQVTVTPAINMNVSTVTFDGVSRKIAISSDDDVSAVDFTVSGLYLGKLVSEVISGPNASLVFGTQLFDVVYSVSADITEPGTTVEVGIGRYNTSQFEGSSGGRTHYFNFDYDARLNSVSVESIVTGAVVWSWKATLQDVTSDTFLDSSLIDPTGTDLTMQSTTKLQSLNVFDYRYSTFIVEDGASGSAEFILLEGGIR